MKLSMSVAALRLATQRALGVAGGRSGTMPILSSVLLTAEQTPEGGRLTARAYDLEIEVTTEHAVDVLQPGAVAVSAKLLADVAKALPAGKVALEASGKRLEVTSGAASFRLALLAAEDFPTSPTLAKDVSWGPVDRERLLAGLHRVHYAMSADETRYNLNGIYFAQVSAHAAADDLALVVTDGHRLAEVRIDGLPAYGLAGDGAIVGRKAIDELIKLLNEETADVADMAFAAGSLLYRRQGLRYVARLIDGQFPDWTQVVPKLDEAAPHMKVNRAALRDVLRRVLLLAGDVASPVSLTLGPDLLKLSTRNADAGDATDQLMVDYRGPVVDAALNGAYLAQLLGAETAEVLRVDMPDAMSPVLVQPVTAGNLRVVHVQMPMRK